MYPPPKKSAGTLVLRSIKHYRSQEWAYFSSPLCYTEKTPTLENVIPPYNHLAY